MGHLLAAVSPVISKDAIAGILQAQVARDPAGRFHECGNLLVRRRRGEIVERGTHQQLLEDNSVYANMWAIQLQEEADDFVHEFAKKI